MTKMHADEVEISLSLVSRLVSAQFPQWTDLPLSPVASGGTDNALYRLGADMVVRLPRISSAVGQSEMEMRWLPVLAPHLPLTIPRPLALGSPSFGYPFTWSVYRWLDGSADVLTPDAASSLASFLLALQGIDTTDAMPARGRGGPLAPRDPHVRAALVALSGTIDVDAAAAAWESALAAPAWDGPPLWLHGDLHGANLLTSHGRLSAVIDFGCLCVGDPACDLMVAWTFLDSAGRDAFRAALPFDDAAWERGRGWALSMALIALPYYRFTNPVLAGIAARTIEQVLYPTARTR
ncbi:aminoglycoside phosphotransferase family protein [Lentzea tibetensis]|uniref:Aminoglycoside phosphotransferase family protein n=1 Tax=Lentzea tibetensis TaxID=2591470 RepID=A0A563EKE4_9PSEU|nr:aminoglycoside phosphotransferase family protein [Lentzea tibetensis]TWP47511.1 aminoglycoside phosphotransferase family protein [Lentzea tibetensis]